jgi:hypothetical protein
MFRGSGGKDAAKRVGDTVSGFSSNLSRQIRDNPIPSLLIGAGLAWLAFAGDEKEASRRRIRRYPGDDLWDETFDEDGFVEYDEYAGDLAQADPLHTMSPSDGLYSPEAEGYAGGDIDVFNQSGDHQRRCFRYHTGGRKRGVYRGIRCLFGGKVSQSNGEKRISRDATRIEVSLQRSGSFGAPHAKKLTPGL